MSRLNSGLMYPMHQDNPPISVSNGSSSSFLRNFTLHAYSILKHSPVVSNLVENADHALKPALPFLFQKARFAGQPLEDVAALHVGSVILKALL